MDGGGEGDFPAATVFARVRPLLLGERFRFSALVSVFGADLVVPGFVADLPMVCVRLSRFWMMPRLVPARRGRPWSASEFSPSVPSPRGSLCCASVWVPDSSLDALFWRPNGARFDQEEIDGIGRSGAGAGLKEEKRACTRCCRRSALLRCSRVLCVACSIQAEGLIGGLGLG